MPYSLQFGVGVGIIVCMKNLEADSEHWAKVGWEYYGRYRQVLHLNGQLMLQVLNEKTACEREIALFYFLMYIPPHGIERHLSRCPDSKEIHLEKITRAATYIVKASRLAALLDRFQEYAQKGVGTREVPFEQDHDLTAYFKRLKLPPVRGRALAIIAPKLTDQPNILTEQALADGRNQATLLLLEGLQRPGINLNLWPFSVAAGIEAMEKSPTLDGGFIGTLATAVDGVDVRYYYPPRVNTPQISLVVKSL